MNTATTLETLYDQHTGLISDKWEFYLAEYDRLFSAFREKPIGMLEVGIQNGGSLEIWSQYFSAAKSIVGCDINPLCAQLAYDDDRITVIIGNINEPETIAKILNTHDNLDIVIDDGSHTSSDIITSFCKLFPHLAGNGIYVVEDLHCSYWEQFQGGLNHPQSSISFFKVLADILNFEHWGIDATRLDILKPFGITSELTETLLAEVHSVEFVNSMCILKKKDKNLNLLGRRRVVGQKESVAPVKYVADTYNHAPKQQPIANPEGTLFFESEKSPSTEEIIANQRDMINKLEARQAELELELSRRNG